MSLKTEFRVGITQREVAFGQDCKALIAAPGIDSQFLAYSLVAHSGQVLAMVDEAGHGTGRLPTDQLERLTIGVPDPYEQQRIADILDSVDESIRTTECLIVKLQFATGALLDRLLARDFDEESLRDRLIQSPRTFVQTGPFGSQLHAYDYVKHGVPVVMPQDIVNGKVDVDSVARIMESKARSLEKHRMRVGDVILARRGDLRKCAVIKPSQEGWLCGTGCLLLRPGPSINPDWLAAIYRHDICQRQIYSVAVGSTMVNLNTNILLSLRIPWPARREQDRVCRVADAAEESIAQANRQLSKLRKLKQGLTADLLTGRVRVGEGVVG